MSTYYSYIIIFNEEKNSANYDKLIESLIDDIVKINSGMINKVSELINTVDTMTKKTSEFINRIEVSAGEGGGKEDTEVEKRLDERLAKLERRVNAVILSGVKTRLRRPVIK